MYIPLLPVACLLFTPPQLQIKKKKKYQKIKRERREKHKKYINF